MEKVKWAERAHAKAKKIGRGAEKEVNIAVDEGGNPKVKRRAVTRHCQAKGIVVRKNES